MGGVGLGPRGLVVKGTWPLPKLESPPDRRKTGEGGRVWGVGSLPGTGTGMGGWRLGGEG